MKAEEFLKKRFKRQFAIQLPEIGGFTLIETVKAFADQQNKELIELLIKMEEHVPHSHQIDNECKLCFTINAYKQSCRQHEDRKMCMSCEKIVDINEGIFTCYECSI